MVSIIFAGIVCVMSIFITELENEKVFKCYISVMFFWLSWAVFMHMI